MASDFGISLHLTAPLVLEFVKLFIPACCSGEKARRQLIFGEISDTSPSLPSLFHKCSPAGGQLLPRRHWQVLRENSYEFIELKYDDATPVFAAFEILKYALLLLISRERREDFRYSHERNPLVWANAVKLIVLAPPNYYAPYSLRWLEDAFNSALTSLSTPELAFQFAFEKIPWPHDRDCWTALRLRESVYLN